MICVGFVENVSETPLRSKTHASVHDAHGRARACTGVHERKTAATGFTRFCRFWTAKCMRQCNSGAPLRKPSPSQLNPTMTVILWFCKYMYFLKKPSRLWKAEWFCVGFVENMSKTPLRGERHTSVHDAHEHAWANRSERAIHEERSFLH